MRKISFSLFLILILVGLLFPFASVNADIENLWCNSYTSNRMGWTTTGSSPYLDDTDGSYINTKTASQTEGDFSFSDLSSTGTITSVTIYIETYANDAPNNDGFYVWIHDGSSWTNEGTIQPSTTGWGTYETLSLTTKLDTDAKVNAAQVYFTLVKIGGADHVYIRRAYLYVDYTPSSAEHYYRYPTQSLSLIGSISRDWTLNRILNQGITLTSDSSRTWSLSRTLNQALTLTSDSKRTLGAVRLSSQILTMTINANRVWSTSRALSQSITTVLNANRVFTAARSASQSLTAAMSSSRTWDLSRIVSQTMTFTSNALADLYTLIQRAASLTIGLVSDSDREWNLKRGLSQGLTLVSGGERMLGAFRTASQSLTASMNANRVFSAIRVVSQTLTTTMNTNRIFTAVRTASQTLTTTLNANRVFSAIRDVSQEITATINANRLWSTSRGVSQTLTTTLNANRVFTAIRGVSQSLTASISAGRTWDLKRILSQSMTLTSNALKDLIKESFNNFHRYVSVGLNLVLDSTRTWDMSRTVSQTITFASEGLGDLMQFFSRSVSLTLNFVSGAVRNVVGWLLSLVVTDFDGIPMEDATVALTRNNSEYINYWKTYANGSIPDQFLSPDDYFLEISKYNYLTNLTTFSMTGNYTLGILMEGAWIETNPEILGLFGLCLLMQVLYAYGLYKGTRPALTMTAGTLTVLAWYVTGQVVLSFNQVQGVPISLLLSGFSTVNTVLLIRVIYALMMAYQEE